MNRIKSQNQQPRRNTNEIQTQINIRTDRALNFVVPEPEQDSDDDSLECSEEFNSQKGSKTKSQQNKKYSDLLYKMIPKIVYKEVLLETKKKDYDAFSYQINPRGSKQRQKAYVLSRTELKKAQVPVDSKPITVYDKLVYMSKAI